MEILLFSWFYATSSCSFHLQEIIVSLSLPIPLIAPYIVNRRVFITSLPQEVIRCQYPQIIIPVINFFSHSRFGIKVPTESKFYEFFLPGLSSLSPTESHSWEVESSVPIPFQYFDRNDTPPAIRVHSISHFAGFRYHICVVRSFCWVHNSYSVPSSLLMIYFSTSLIRVYF